jgi:hypothetical protein
MPDRRTAIGLERRALPGRLAYFGRIHLGHFDRSIGGGLLFFRSSSCCSVFRAFSSPEMELWSGMTVPLLFKRPRERRRLVFENCIARIHTIKIVRAYGGCLGTGSRRRTWQAAISRVELQAGYEARISEWGNPARVMPCHPHLNT